MASRDPLGSLKECLRSPVLSADRGVLRQQEAVRGSRGVLRQQEAVRGRATPLLLDDVHCW